MTFKPLRIFRNLAETRERPLPYDVDLVEQRSKYGEGLLRRADDQRQKQTTWENEQTERHLEAVRRRQEERRKQEQIEVRTLKVNRSEGSGLTSGLLLDL